MKEFSFHDPYGQSKFYKEAVENVGLEKLAKLTGICAMLLQTKVYLFWKEQKAELAWNLVLKLFHGAELEVTVSIPFL